MTNAAKAAIYVGADKFKGFRAIASVVVARYAREAAREGFHAAWPRSRVEAYCQRWKLGDFFAAVLSGYEMDVNPLKKRRQT